MNELEKSDEEREGDARVTLRVLSRSAGSRSLNDTLHFVTSPNYEKNTSQKWVLRMLQYFERTYFTSRPQAGYWFPRCSFGRGCRKWNALACPEQVEVDFDAEKPRIPASRLATICVQAAAAAIWSNGFKVTPMGTFNFKPAMVHSHDVKRGVAIELPASGVVPIQTDLLGTADLFLLQTDRFVLTICLRVLHGRSQYH
jgi:hypothetical protein